MDNVDSNLILAKSDPFLTLVEHVKDCLQVFENLKKAIPNLPKSIQNDQFWKLLRISILFHDVGKAHAEFQKKLKGHANNWHHQRHELFSLPFIEALTLFETEKELIKLVVAGHHKSFNELFDLVDKNYKSNGNNFGLLGVTETENKLTFEESFNAHVKIENLNSFFVAFRLPINSSILPKNPSKFLKGYIRGSINTQSPGFLEKLLLAGAFKHCDHLGSAGISTINTLSADNFSFLHSKSFKFYKHQLEAEKIHDSIILTAPTGSGKTESALLWLNSQINNRGQGRVFYILPFTASINAMYERLDKSIGPGYCGMLHGRIAEYLESKFEDDDFNELATYKKKQILENFRNLTTPLKIVTPFQLLKHIFGLKGFEKGIFEWVGGYFIFDEIHAYDPKVFAQIIVLLEFSTRYLNTRVFIMTATMPSFLRSELQKSIGSYSTIQANDELYESFTRHRVIVHEGLLNDFLNEIQQSVDSNKRVLIVCNTIKQAQEVYRNLNADRKVLLHSAFNSEDRNIKEKELQNEDIQLLVGTQAIEVSLDIDFDLIYTEPAPFDALIQRFGRVNRRRMKGVSTCFVFKERNDVDKYIYTNEEIIKRTISALQKIENEHAGIIKEKELQEAIEFVYPSWDAKDKDDFDQVYKYLSHSIKYELAPFIQNLRNESEFYEQFSGIKVLPIKHLEEYRLRLEQNKFQKAESLKVQINEHRFIQFLKEKKIFKEIIAFESLRTEKLLEQNSFIIDRKYDSEIGLQMDIDEDVKSIKANIF